MFLWLLFSCYQQSSFLHAGSSHNTSPKPFPGRGNWSSPSQSAPPSTKLFSEGIHHASCVPVIEENPSTPQPPTCRTPSPFNPAYLTTPNSLSPSCSLPSLGSTNSIAGSTAHSPTVRAVPAPLLPEFEMLSSLKIEGADVYLDKENARNFLQMQLERERDFADLFVPSSEFKNIKKPPRNRKYSCDNLLSEKKHVEDSSPKNNIVSNGITPNTSVRDNIRKFSRRHSSVDAPHQQSSYRPKASTSGSSQGYSTSARERINKFNILNKKGASSRPSRQRAGSLSNLLSEESNDAGSDSNCSVPWKDHFSHLRRKSLDPLTATDLMSDVRAGICYLARAKSC